MANVTLVTFIKGFTDPKRKMPGCANYDHHYGGCLFSRKKICKVEDGKKCEYFEKAVLPTAIDTSQFERIYNLYSRQLGIETDESIVVRTCPKCGAELKPRRRLCDKCRDDNNRKNKRKWKNNN